MKADVTTMISIRLLSAAAARLKPFCARHPANEHVRPLALASGLLLYALILVADSNIDLIDLPGSSFHSWLKSDVEHALAAVQTSMVELPLQTEAAAVAQLGNKMQMVLLENRRLAAEIRALETDHAELRQGYEAQLAELQRSIQRTQSEVRWLLSQQEHLENNLKIAMAGRHPVDTPPSPNSPHDEGFEGGDVSVKGHEFVPQVAETPAGVANTVGSDTQLETAPVPLTETDESARSFASLVALRIARGLQDTRREAMLLRQERAFTIDVDRRLFKTGAASEPVLLDHDVGLSLYTARSELAGHRSGRIRFFPDGSSTGGRIDLELHGGRAAVKVDWSTGLVTVDG
jgi:general secretion pathway protein H